MCGIKVKVMSCCSEVSRKRFGASGYSVPFYREPGTENLDRSKYMVSALHTPYGLIE